MHKYALLTVCLVVLYLVEPVNSAQIWDEYLPETEGCFKRLYASEELSCKPNDRPWEFAYCNAKPEEHAASEVTTLNVLISTHWDIGYTDYLWCVINRFFHTIVPEVYKTLRVYPNLKYTIHPFYGWAYINCERLAASIVAAPKVHLKCPREEGVKFFIEKVKAKNFVFHGFPWDGFNELADASLVEFGFDFVKNFTNDPRFEGLLDEEVSFMQIDPPGISSAQIPLMLKKGIKGIYIGQNSGGLAYPSLPRIFNWVSPNDPADKIMFMYHPGNYGGVGPNDAIFHPNGKEVLITNICVENQHAPGPGSIKMTIHTAKLYFPNVTEIHFVSLSDWVKKLLPVAEQLPSLSFEMGDFWWHNSVSDSKKVSFLREISRLRTNCIETGGCPKPTTNPEFADASIALLGATEHNYGLEPFRGDWAEIRNGWIEKRSLMRQTYNLLAQSNNGALQGLAQNISDALQKLYPKPTPLPLFNPTQPDPSTTAAHKSSAGKFGVELNDNNEIQADNPLLYQIDELPLPTVISALDTNEEDAKKNEGEQQEKRTEKTDPVQQGNQQQQQPMGWEIIDMTPSLNAKAQKKRTAAIEYDVDENQHKVNIQAEKHTWESHRTDTSITVDTWTLRFNDACSMTYLQDKQTGYTYADGDHMLGVLTYGYWKHPRTKSLKKFVWHPTDGQVYIQKNDDDTMQVICKAVLENKLDTEGLQATTVHMKYTIRSPGKKVREFPSAVDGYVVDGYNMDNILTLDLELYNKTIPMQTTNLTAIDLWEMSIGFNPTGTEIKVVGDVDVVNTNIQANPDTMEHPQQVKMNRGWFYDCLDSFIDIRATIPCGTTRYHMTQTGMYSVAHKPDNTDKEPYITGIQSLHAPLAFLGQYKYGADIMPNAWRMFGSQGIKNDTWGRKINVNDGIVFNLWNQVDFNWLFMYPYLPHDHDMTWKFQLVVSTKNQITQETEGTGRLVTTDALTNGNVVQGDKNTQPSPTTEPKNGGSANAPTVSRRGYGGGLAFVFVAFVLAGLVLFFWKFGSNREKGYKPAMIEM